eukprot:PhF_6_TR37042/c0_g1_i1/m.54201
MLPRIDDKKSKKQEAVDWTSSKSVSVPSHAKAANRSHLHQPHHVDKIAAASERPPVTHQQTTTVVGPRPPKGPKSQGPSSIRHKYHVTLADALPAICGDNISAAFLSQLPGSYMAIEITPSMTKKVVEERIMASIGDKLKAITMVETHSRGEILEKETIERNNMTQRIEQRRLRAIRRALQNVEDESDARYDTEWSNWWHEGFQLLELQHTELSHRFKLIRSAFMVFQRRQRELITVIQSIHALKIQCAFRCHAARRKVNYLRDHKPPMQGIRWLQYAAMPQRFPMIDFLAKIPRLSGLMLLRECIPASQLVQMSAFDGLFLLVSVTNGAFEESVAFRQQGVKSCERMLLESLWDSGYEMLQMMEQFEFAAMMVTQGGAIGFLMNYFQQEEERQRFSLEDNEETEVYEILVTLHVNLEKLLNSLKEGMMDRELPRVNIVDEEIAQLLVLQCVECSRSFDSQAELDQHVEISKHSQRKKSIVVVNPAQPIVIQQEQTQTQSSLPPPKMEEPRSAVTEDETLYNDDLENEEEEGTVASNLQETILSQDVLFDVYKLIQPPILVLPNDGFMYQATKKANEDNSSSYNFVRLYAKTDTNSLDQNNYFTYCKLIVKIPTTELLDGPSLVGVAFNTDDYKGTLQEIREKNAKVSSRFILWWFHALAQQLLDCSTKLQGKCIPVQLNTVLVLSEKKVILADLTTLSQPKNRSHVWSFGVCLQAMANPAVTQQNYLEGIASLSTASIPWNWTRTLLDKIFRDESSMIDVAKELSCVVIQSIARRYLERLRLPERRERRKEVLNKMRRKAEQDDLDYAVKVLQITLRYVVRKWKKSQM